MRVTRRADYRNVAAVANSTASVLETASSSAPTAGLAKNDMLSIELETTFAAVSSSGRSASDGSKAPFAGSNAGATTSLTPRR
jgi:hypothetical protein